MSLGSGDRLGSCSTCVGERGGGGLGERTLVVRLTRVDLEWEAQCGRRSGG